MLSPLTLRPVSLAFGARKKSADAAKPAAPKKQEKPASPFPIYYLITSGGDGSYAPHFFKTREERDKALAWVEEHDYEPVCESDGAFTEADIFTSADAFIKERT